MLKQIIVSTISALAVFAVTTATLMAESFPTPNNEIIDESPNISSINAEELLEETVYTQSNYKNTYLSCRLPSIYVASSNDYDYSEDEIFEDEDEASDIDIEEDIRELGIDDGVYPSCPFLDHQDTDRIVWYTGNMKLCNNETSSTEYDWNEEDLEWLAKIIHCEICDQGSEARRAVGTVIMNRVEWNECPDTILGVISQKNQFSPWGSGLIFDTVPCSYCEEAAYDVLVNGYRAFPREVRYFQSIEDGYFDNLLTYAYYTESGFDTWFCFNPEDIDTPNI